MEKIEWATMNDYYSHPKGLILAISNSIELLSSIYPTLLVFTSLGSDFETLINVYSRVMEN